MGLYNINIDLFYDKGILNCFGNSKWQQSARHWIIAVVIGWGFMVKLNDYCKDSLWFWYSVEGRDLMVHWFDL